MSAYAQPVFIRDGAAQIPARVALEAGKTQSSGSFSEAWLQRTLFEHPQALPVREIVPAVQKLVPICIELDTGAGYADVLYLTAASQIVLVETKLWRNPEGRREVVSQILDYAKQLTRWRYEDLDAAVAKCTGKGAGYVLKAMRERVPDLDEREFIDGINRNLGTGDLLLLIVGDGIRSSTEALIGFLERYGSLRFSFGLIEVAVHQLEGGYFVQPRVLAKTEVLRRTVFIPQTLPAGQSLGEAEQAASAGPLSKEVSPEQQAAREWYESYWRAFLQRLKLDLQTQPPPKPTRDTNIYLPMPPSGQSCWMSAYVARGSGNAGVYITWMRSYELARDTYEALLAAREDIEREVGQPLAAPATPAIPPAPAMPLDEAYKLLKATHGATWESIEQTRRLLVQASHPDKLRALADSRRTQALLEAKRVNEAYATLSLARCAGP